MSIAAPAFNDAQFRAQNVGAAEVSALFDANPWLTRFELWHRKNGTIATPDLSDNERVQAGIYMEPAIVTWACAKFGYSKLATPSHIDNGRGLAGHPDQVVMCPRRGRGVLEVKTADWLVAKGWGDEPPLHYQIQALTYAGLLYVDWADIIVLVGGNELRRFEYPFRPVVYADIEARVAEFWRSVRAGEAPAPDYARDRDVLVEALGPAGDDLIDLRHDVEADELAAEWLEAKAAEKAAKARASIAECRLIEKVGDAGRAMLPGHKLSCATTIGSPGTEITADMVGTVINKRAGYRRFDVKEITK